MSSVYVIIGSSGEYSEHSDWVAGVFIDKGFATSLAEEKLHVSREASALYDEWCWCKEKADLAWRHAHPDAVINWGGPPWRSAEWEAFILERTGPRPDSGEAADDYTVVEVPLNEWGRWDNSEP